MEMSDLKVHFRSYGYTLSFDIQKNKNKQKIQKQPLLRKWKEGPVTPVTLVGRDTQSKV